MRSSGVSCWSSRSGSLQLNRASDRFDMRSMVRQTTEPRRRTETRKEPSGKRSDISHGDTEATEEPGFAGQRGSDRQGTKASQETLELSFLGGPILAGPPK